MEVSFNRYPDERGELVSLWRADELDIRFVEDRLSKSHKGTVRGFHGDWSTHKLVFCLSGEFRLVLFDMYTEEKKEYVLSESSNFGVLIPPGTLNAHQAITDCTLFYKWSKKYSGPENQISIFYNDRFIDPNWTNVSHVSKRDITAEDYLTFKTRFQKHMEMLYG